MKIPKIISKNNHEYIFVKKVCSKCENRLNKIDLCHITITTNGKAKCVNEKIKEGRNESI